MEENPGALSRARHVWSFIQKHAMLFTLVLILVLQWVPNNHGTYPWGGMWMRMQNRDFPFADSAAESSAENYLQQKASEMAQKQYPNLPASGRQKAVQDLLIKIREENKDQVESEKKRLAQQIRDQYFYETDTGAQYMYMPDIDPYFYLRYARNIIEKGHPYDTLKDGVPWDNHMSAPVGTGADPNWHPYILVAVYRMMSIFDRNMPLMEGASYFPIMFIFLSLILAYFIAYRISGPIGGAVSVTILAVLPAIMGRTLFSHPDTDTYNIFFPLLVIWLLFEALSSKSRNKQLLFGGLAGAAIGIYSAFWSGWWYLIDFVLGAFAVAALAEFALNYKKLKEGIKAFWHHSNLKKFFTIGITLFAVAAIICTFTIGFLSFINATFKAAILHSTIKEAALPSLWPNVFTTVAELNPASFNEIIGQVGGMIMFLISVLGIILLLIKRDEHGKFDFTYSALLTIWFIGTVYMSLKGVRFILLLGPAFAVAFGAAAGLLYQRLSSFGEKHLHIKKAITGALIIIILGLLIINPAKAGAHMVQNSYQTAINDVPLVNDAWYDSLTKIKDNSQENAIVNSWWDFGHHFKYFSDRAVTFDGSSQNSPQAHWIGHVLQTDNEEEAVAILRMLDCGANKAYDEIMKVTNDPLASVRLVKNMIMVDKDSAIQLAKEAGVPESIVQYTHCDPPEDFFITSGDMIGKAGVWGHFGLWNFDKAEVWQKWKFMDQKEAVPQMAQRFNISEEQAKQWYRTANAQDSEEAGNQWISPWPGYLMQDPSSCSIKGDALLCGKIAINITSKQGAVQVSKGIALAGKIIKYDKQGNRNELVTSEGNQGMEIVVWPTGDGLSAIVATSELAESMFTRLYYMKGLGLKHFKPFDEQRQIIGGMVYVWKVDWQGSEGYIPQDLQPKSQVESGAQVSLNYIGWTDDGKVFDSSIPGWKNMSITPETSFDSVKTEPLEFIYGRGSLIPGFEAQIQGMKPGEMKTIVVPPEDAYGTDPTKHPLGNKTLHFKVRIESVQ